MSVQVIDGNKPGRLAELGQRVLDGGAITRDEALRLLALDTTADIFELIAWANRIRVKLIGNQIRLCSIVNAKAGGCSEDCRFCAQSAFYQTGAPRHDFIEPEPVLTAAREAHKNGVAALGIVAAWRGLREGPLLDEVCERFQQLARSGLAHADASLGQIPTQAIANRLKDAGVVTYNHNLESSRRFFPQVCTTHTYDDRIQTIHFLKNAGIKICSGGILGLGETAEDRCDLALTLRELEVDCVPMNFLNPIAGTPFAHLTPLAPMEILKSIAVFRFILPRQEILLAGGRTVNLRDLQALAFPAGASAMMVGNYLTTANQPVEKDLQMLKDLGLTPRIGDEGAARAMIPGAE